MSVQYGRGNERTVACSIFYGLFMITTARMDDMRAATSPRFAEKRKSEEIPFRESFAFLNDQPEVRKVLVLDPRVPVYYSNKAYLKPYGRNGEETMPDYTGVSQILADLARLHVSHVLDVDREGSPFQLPEDTRGLTLVFALDHQRIYRVDEMPVRAN